MAVSRKKKKEEEAPKPKDPIAIGKEADMVLVDGDVSTEIGALRRTVWVMTDGRLIDADALREAVGFSGRPR